MKKILFLTSFVFAYSVVCNAQEITINGAWDIVVKSPQNGSKIILKGGDKIELNNATLTCDEFIIEKDVTKIKITGTVKIICKRSLTDNTPNNGIEIIGDSKGVLIIQKAPKVGDVKLNNQSPDDLEIKTILLNEK